MGSFSFMMAKEIAPAEIYSDMPPPFRSYLNRGFSQLAQSEERKVGQMIDSFASGVDFTDDGRLDEMSRVLGVTPQDARAVSAALSFLIAFVTGRDDFDEVINAGSTVGVIAPANVDKVREIGQRLAKIKPALKQMVEVAALVSEVAPSFKSFDATTDLRFKFDDESKLLTSTPVAICYLETDSRDSRCFFQMSRSDVAQLIKQLHKLESQLSQIDQWAKEHK